MLRAPFYSAISGRAVLMMGKALELGSRSVFAEGKPACWTVCSWEMDECRIRCGKARVHGGEVQEHLLSAGPLMICGSSSLLVQLVRKLQWFGFNFALNSVTRFLLLFFLKLKFGS